MTAEVVLIDGTNQPHPQIASSVERLFEMYQKETGDVLGIIEGKTLEAQVGAVANLMRWHTKMEVGVIHRGAFREKLKTDSLYVRDVERFVRFDYGLVKVQLSGAQLRSVIKRSQRAGKGDNGLIFAGLDVSIEAITQKEPPAGVNTAAISLITQFTDEAKVLKAIGKLESLSQVSGAVKLIRIEHF